MEKRIIQHLLCMVVLRIKLVAFLVALVVKNLLANVGDVRDTGLIFG